MAAMSLTTNRFRTATGERLATVRLTLHVSADEIATALMDATGAAYGDPDTEVPVTEEAIRDALLALFHAGMEIASFRIADNHVDARLGEVQAEVVEKVFGGNEHYERPS